MGIKWLKCCCCWSNSEEKVVDDSSSLVHQGPIPDNTSQVHEFYVPRRHSSFQPRSKNPVSAQPERSCSDSCSSSDGDDTPEPRARCWSTVPQTDVTSMMDSHSRVNKNNSVCTPLVFQHHILDEIAENEQQPGTEPSKPPNEVYGYMTFTISYNEQEQRLSVFLLQAFHLPKKTDEPYATFVRSSLTSSRKNTFQISRSLRKSYEPCFNEEHVFHSNRSKWKSSSGYITHLRLSMFDNERQGRHDAIGHVLFPLEEMGTRTREYKLPLTPMTLPVKGLGQVLVSLLYSPVQSHLAVHVIKGRRLQLNPEIHKSHLRAISRDPLETFCKVTLTCGGEKVKTCRSQPIQGSDPFFNFRTNFVVPPQYLRDSSIIVTVVTRSTLGRQGVTLGRTAPLGPYVELGDGNVTQWGKMAQEEKQVVHWRNLYL